MADNVAKKTIFTSTRIIMLGFAVLIILGALLLMIPAATVEGEHTSFLTALFTATTSVSVTGLVVVDTFSHWTLFGKIIILILIQTGGFGVITIYSMFMIALSRKFSLRDRLLIQDYYNLDSVQGLVRFLIKVVKGTFLVEGGGALLYSFIFVRDFGLPKGIWIAVFTSISAFCNAGIDIIGPNSLMDYYDNPAVNIITMTLIVLGGIGYIVWFDFLNKAEYCRKHSLGFRSFIGHLNVHTRLALRLTLLLILAGWAFVFFFEYSNPATIGDMSLGNKLMTSLFQSVTFRTAGFATVPQQNLTSETCMLGLGFMFIGGSPVGTAGGVKTVTVFIILLNVISFIRHRDETVVFSRKVTTDLINKATAVVTVSLAFTLFFLLLLVHTEDVPVMSAAYEIFSATATVGLSRGLTPNLGTAGRIIVILAMYIGRIGPISMALFFTTRRSIKNNVSFAEGKFTVG